MRACALAAVLCLAACAEEAEAPAREPMALVDAYLIAHGMAQTYAESDSADPAVVGELVKLDRKAADAIRSLTRVRTGDEAATAAAVAALTGFAARQASVPQ